MQAQDVMVYPVITVAPTATVRDAAALMLERHVSALPVVDAAGKLVGILSEGDLMRRVETGTERRKSWWLRLFTVEAAAATEYAKAHARSVADVMSTRVITATPETRLHEIATLLEKHRIKRVPIVWNGEIVGIVSRANLVQALATARQPMAAEATDTEIRKRIMAELGDQPWADTLLINVTVKDGVVDLWGITRSDAEKTAIRVAAETTPGVKSVNDNLVARAIAMTS